MKLIVFISRLFLERAREPVALYFAVGLSLFAGFEPGGLSLILGDMLDSNGFNHFCIISKDYAVAKKEKNQPKFLLLFYFKQ